MNNWIKTKERLPTAEEMPVWLGSYQSGQVVMQTKGPERDPTQFALSSHWIPVERPLPIPAPAHEQQDETAFNEWYRLDTCPMACSGHAERTWHAALAWERAEITRLADIHDECTTNGINAIRIVDNIRARCTP